MTDFTYRSIKPDIIQSNLARIKVRTCDPIQTNQIPPRLD